jgi:nicotinamidase-related amidase
MQALLVVDAQNEFSTHGLRPVPNHAAVLAHIRQRVEIARQRRQPIGWIQHHNKPNESRAFVPGSWGAQLSPGLGPEPGATLERLFVKDVFGAFTNTGIEEWLRQLEVTAILITGFYAHMCLSTSVREALIRGFDVQVDPMGTGGCELDDEYLGRLTAEEVCRTALLHLRHMGATLAPPLASAVAVARP